MRKLILAVACGITGCGTSTVIDDGEPIDANVAQDAGRLDARPSEDAGSDANACAPTAMRTVPCGNCGLAQQICGSDGTWGAPGTCLGEGECGAAAVDTETTPMCGMRSRICNDSCHWSDWTVVAPDGECVAGDVTSAPDPSCGPSALLENRCSDTCVLTTACVPGCGGTRRTDPPDSEELCVPEGPFVRGTTAFADTQPVAEIMMSAYYIDRFPVTNDRFRACIDAGGCASPVLQQTRDDLADPTLGHYPVRDPLPEESAAFCTWDGGRMLPSEAQWEKAARGPSPRSQPFPWGDTFACENVGCDPLVAPYELSQVDARPAGASYYGVEMLLGGGYEYTRDVYDAAYYSTAASLSADPVNVTGVGHALRGVPAALPATAYDLSTRYSHPLSPNVFRCLR